MSWFVGIDPGTSRQTGSCGQVCFLNEDYNEVKFFPTWNYELVRDRLKCWKEEILFAVVEDVSAHFGKPHGDAQRHLERLEWLQIRHAAVSPIVWQQFLGEHKRKKEVNKIKPSVEFIRARFPEFVQYVRKEKSGFDSNKADALVLAMYAEKLFKR